MKRFVAILLAVLLPVYILLFSLELTTFHLNFFERHIEENNIEGDTGKTREELMDIFDDLLLYLKGEKLDLSQHFNNREVEHMVDVQDLFKKGFKLKKEVFFLLVLSIAYIVYKRAYLGLFLDIIYRGLYFWWVAIGIFFTLAIFDFTRYFTLFHQIFFDNDLWLLDPSQDLMIQMLPEIFFTQMFKKIIVVFLLILFFLHLGLYIVRKKRGRQGYA